ncbi:hypothetical protein [Paraburkholderia caribensis]|uniref:hypothetical protein n=1 Tax=Paraburkholderia caribensis TaxID=75105 RepID=UPI002090D98F|nr:hypothetical protein [Paraburkholderia caribensis]MCO4880238.1 hypothetical protein [Paraburkholderia caribensis]
MAADDIVVINVSTQFAPKANNLQKIGDLVSQGGTTLAPGTRQLITQKKDLTSILKVALNNTALQWATGTVTVTTSTPHGIPTGDTVRWTVQGAIPAAYNGTFDVTSLTADSFTYSLVNNPGAATGFGTSIDASVSEVTAMANTYFAQGRTNSVYVLELGEGTAAEGVADLRAYLDANANREYGFLVPRSFAAEASFPALVGDNSANDAMVYFFTTFSTQNAANAGAFAGMKGFFGFVEDDNTPVTEFTLASVFFKILNRSPSNAEKVPPLQNGFLTGVTNGQFTDQQISTYQSLNLSYAIVGSEGGLTNTILKGGKVGSGVFFNFWYSTDWAIINLHLNLANEVINGSNSTINPLYYRQSGIDRLEGRAQQVMNSGISFGLFLDPAPVSAVDFVTYTTSNPSDYAAGLYTGLSCQAVPQNGFTRIEFQLEVTDIPGAVAQ